MTAPSPDAVLHLAALHTLAAAGFASSSRAASLTLSATLGRYIRLVALTCTARATLAGRSKVAAIDVLNALEELGVGGIGELQEWAVGLDQEVSLSAPGLLALGEEVREGLPAEDALAELRLVPAEQVPAEEAEESSDDDVSVKDEAMELDDRPTHRLRFKSPDWSWLPPLPSDDIPAQSSSSSQAPAPSSHPDPAALTAPAGSLSIIDRYRRRIPFSRSQLAEARPFVDPPVPSSLPPPPPVESSFPALQTAYAATKNEPTIALRQTALRQQASDLLRRTIASPDHFTPPDTLIVPLPGPRISPIIPSYSANEAIPHRSIPIVSDPKGILTRLVHEIRSPHLPPQLRERLTSVRPPVAQMRDGQPILYGPEIRGPSEAALLRAKGKHAEAEKADQGVLQATWPTPAKGVERYGQKLVIPRNALSSGVGEDQPRVPAGSRPVQTPGVQAPPVSPFNEDTGDGSATPGPGGLGGQGGAGGSKIKLRLSAPSPSITITNANPLDDPATPMAAAKELSAGPIGSNARLSPVPPTPTTTSPGGSTGLKLKLGVKKSPSVEAPSNGTMDPPPTRPVLSLKLSSRSISPYKPPEQAVKTERRDSNASRGSDGTNGH